MLCKIGKRDALSGIILVAFLCLAAIPAASAFTATLASPANTGVSVSNGNTIDVQIGGLVGDPAGDSLTYRVYSTDLAVTRNSVTFSGLKIPFSFKDGSVTTNLVTSGISNPSLAVTRQSDGTQVTVTGTNVSHFNVKKDTYTIVITGTPTGSTASVDYSVSGVISDAGGAGPVTLSLPISNINTGHITVEVDQGATKLLSDTFTIVTPTPTPGQTTTATLPLSGGVVSTTTTVQTDASATVSSAVVVNSGTTVVASDGTTPVSQITATTVDPASVPQTSVIQSGKAFAFAGVAVEYGPPGTKFVGGSTTISFTLTPDQWTTAVNNAGGNPNNLVIQTYNKTSSTWEAVVPTTVNQATYTVSAQITHFSTYAVFAQTQPSSGQPTGPSGGGGGGTTGGATSGATGGLLAPPQENGQQLLAPQGISATSVTIQHDTGGKTLNDYTISTDPAAGFTSSVGITQGTTVLTSAGQPIDTVSVTPLDPKSVPSQTNTQGGVFSFSGLSVECSPSGAQFTGGSATISFSLTPQQWADALTKVNGDTSAMTIQFYDTTKNTWVGITTNVDPVSHTVTAQVSHFSTYALFYKLTSESTSAPSSQTTTAASGTTSTAIATPAHTLNAPPAPSTTQSPGLPGIVVIGVIGIVGYCISRKKQ
jgi:hypothetical protein